MRLVGTSFGVCADYSRGKTKLFFKAIFILTFSLLLADLSSRIFSRFQFADEFDIHLQTHLFLLLICCLLFTSCLVIYWYVCLLIFLSRWIADEQQPWTCNRSYIGFSSFEDEVVQDEADRLFWRSNEIMPMALVFYDFSVNFILDAESSYFHLPVSRFYFWNSQSIASLM